MKINREGTTSTFSKPSKTVASFRIVFSTDKPILRLSKELQTKLHRMKLKKKIMNYLFIVQPNIREYDEHVIDCLFLQFGKSELLEVYRKPFHINSSMLQSYK